MLHQGKKSYGATLHYENSVGELLCCSPSKEGENAEGRLFQGYLLIPIPHTSSYYRSFISFALGALHTKNKKLGDISITPNFEHAT